VAVSVAWEVEEALASSIAAERLREIAYQVGTQEGAIPQERLA